VAAAWRTGPLVSAARRGAARDRRQELLERRERYAVRLERVRRAPEGRYNAGGAEHVIMPGDEYTVRDRHGALVISERSPDYLVPMAVYARALYASPKPLRKAVPRRGKS
jgi:hypothetical protein